MPGAFRRATRGIVIASVALLAGSFADAADKPASGGKPADATLGRGKHFLWKVTDAKAPVYLLGSIHALRKKDYPLSPVIERVIHQSQQYYFEWDFDENAVFKKKMYAAAMYPKGVKLKEKIRPQLYKYLGVYSRDRMHIWGKFKPWAIAMFGVRGPWLRGIDDYYGLDSYVYRKAKAMRRPVHGLATVDEHLEVMSGMSDIEGEVFLLEALVFANQSPARVGEAIAAWKAGDPARVAALELPQIKEAPRLNQRINQDRNVRWIPKIEAAINSGKPTLIVAGAAHFSGSGNVISLLRARGHKIEQL